MMCDFDHKAKSDLNDLSQGKVRLERLNARFMLPNGRFQEKRAWNVSYSIAESTMDRLSDALFPTTSKFSPAIGVNPSNFSGDPSRRKVPHPPTEPATFASKSS
jgi:hypothetical protein